MLGAEPVVFAHLDDVVSKTAAALAFATGGAAYVQGGKHVMVVVVSAPADGRHWIITAYIARRLAEGVVEWKRN